jgi:hypothetical protein
MSVTADEITLTLRGLLEGNITCDSAVILARHNRSEAEHQASMLWLDIKSPSSLETNGGAWRLAEFIWLLCGPTQALIKITGLKTSKVLHSFLTQRLQRFPDEFSQQDLAYILASCGEPSVVKEVKNLQNIILKQKAEGLRKQPVELANDVSQVKRRVSEYSFNPELNELLEKVEQGMIAPGDKFDQSAIVPRRKFVSLRC